MLSLSKHGVGFFNGLLCGPGGVEDRAFSQLCKLTNPNMKCTALQVPPRQDKDDICCRWEVKVERP